MIIAQISDTHILAPGGGDPAGAGRSENLRQCIGDINGSDPQPDTVLHTGDMTQHGRDDEFDLSREILSALQAPLFVTLGNRDGRDGVARAFAGEAWLPANPVFIQYAVDGFPVGLVAIDSLASNARKGDFCKARLNALDAILCEAPDWPTALFLHHPRLKLSASAILSSINSAPLPGHTAILRSCPPVPDGFGQWHARQYRCVCRHRFVQGKPPGDPGSQAGVSDPPFRR